jgi:hypothetical protein
MKLTTTALTHLGFQINAALERSPALDLSFAEVHEAADACHLVEHLAKRLAGQADFYLLTSDCEQLASLEAALRDAAEALRGQEGATAEIEKSGLCLVMAIVLEAIQQKFANVPEPVIADP